MGKYTVAKQTKLDDLRFDAAKHRYSWRGIPILGVTTILDDMLNFSGVPRDLLIEAQERGTMVHHLTELMDTGEDKGTVPGDWSGYMQAWDKFKQETGFEVFEIEQKVFSAQHLFAGTLDRTGKMRKHREPSKRDALSVVDIKTGMMYPTYALQTAAYQAAANEGRLGERITERLGVQLKPDGTYHIEEYTDRFDIQVFLSQIVVYSWKVTHGR